MIAITRYLSFFLLLSLFSLSSSAQCDANIVKKYVAPLGRQSFHDEISKEQKRILASDGRDDKQFSFSANEDVNFLVTKALTSRIDCIKYNLEKDSLIKDQKKVRYLRGLTYMLRNLQSDWRVKQFSPASLPAVISAYEYCVELDKKKQSIFNYISKLDYAIATPIVRSTGFDDNQDIKLCKQELVRKFCGLYPEQTLFTLKNNPGLPFADSLVRTVSRRYPRQLYDYAQASNDLGRVIRNIKDDSFIVIVSQMARSRKGQQYFPFLDNIIKGKMTIAQIDAVEGDSLQYYRLLVKTQMDYVERAMNRDTAYEFASLTKKLEFKAQTVFVNTINGLHDVSNHAIRFRIIQPLTAEELYYLAVMSDGIIYTSSFTKGVYPLMMSKSVQSGAPRGDSVLMRVKFDKFRKFIKMAAAYNTLGEFLATFPQSKSPDQESPANTLMKAFVKNLEKSSGLEDGVDVADSYASISETLKPVADQMLRNIQVSYQRNLEDGNKRGAVIYHILERLFLSADTTNYIDLTKELKIPPVYSVPYKVLADSSDRIAIQLFIYGDKDGIGLFPGLVGMFRNANWKIDDSNKQWVTVTAAKGKPVTIYMNRPLPEEKDEDAKAQEALCDYLKKNGIVPTVTVNRGHSYNAGYTVDQMSHNSKIVFMGSCGGYRLIHDILEKAPDAHIIGSKQVADAEVNNPFLKLLTEKLRTGNNIEWVPFWKELHKMAMNDIFDDYIPPYKNLGALFIKAYKIAMDE
jgi:hypothetical protein